MNDLATVRRVLDVLDSAGALCYLFGGWAEELRGLRAPGPHGDIDLLCPAEDFTTVDTLLATGRVEEITLKRFAHKRAFLLDGVMTELLLVRHDKSGHYTSFWEGTRHAWPHDTLTSPASFDRPVASAAALNAYRQSHPRLAAARDACLAQRDSQATR